MTKNDLLEPINNFSERILKIVAFTTMNLPGTMVFLDETNAYVTAQIKHFFPTVIIHSITTYDAKLLQTDVKTIEKSYSPAVYAPKERKPKPDDK